MSGRAVIFDFGGVLARQDWGDYDAFDRDHGLPARTLARALYGTAEWMDLQTGRGNRETWQQAAVREVARHAGERAGELLAAWWARPPLRHEPNLLLAGRLQGAGHRIGLLSNAAPDLRERITSEFGIGLRWNHMVISGLVGMAKPDPAIYRLAAEGIGLPPERCFFIDDAERNVEAARQVGMAAYRFVGRDYEGLQQALRAAGDSW